PLQKVPDPSKVDQLSDLPPICGTLLTQTEGKPDKIQWVGSANAVVDHCSGGRFFEPLTIEDANGRTHYLHSGFHAREAWGAWSSSGTSIVIARSPGHGDRTVSLLARALVPFSQSQQSVS